MPRRNGAGVILMQRFLTIVSCLVAFLDPMVGHSASTGAGTIDPQDYFGVYVFEDGVRVSGGRFDEAGNQMLLYMDTANVSRGSTLKRSNTDFVPAFGFGDVNRVSFNEGKDLMRWETGAGEVLEARRVMQPEFISASFNNRDTTLAGTLYLPGTADLPIPAVVLAHGSGPVTRYAGTWITFFLEQGLAVLAYDKRGTGESGGDWRSSTYLDLAQDLSAAVRWLKTRPEVEGEKIGVGTSSQSGWYGPRTAIMNDDIDFLIQRAGPAVNIGIGTAHEMREGWRADGLPEADITRAVDFWLDLHRLAATKASLTTANSRLQRARESEWFAPTFGELERIEPGWWRRHVANMQLEPACDVADLRIPVLWFLAEEDENVPYDSSLEALVEARKENPDLSIVTVHDAPHSFLLEDSEGRLRYSDEYWGTMAEWLNHSVLGNE